MDADIWRMPAQGGPAERITKNGGAEPQESPDGQYLYYLDRPPLEGTIGRLMRVPVGGGDPRVIHEGVSPLYWCVADKGIYFLLEEGQVHSIHLYRFADETTKRVGVLPFRITYRPQGRGRLTVSHDGRWTLVNVTDRWEGDLMLLDSFR